MWELNWRSVRLIAVVKVARIQVIWTAWHMAFLHRPSLPII